MPVKIPDGLPAAQVLSAENIFVMTNQRSAAQDIRPLQIAILNLMPTKENTETQLMRLIGNTPLQVEITLLRTETYASTHTDKAHLKAFYRTFGEVSAKRFDGLIITGAPVEQLAFHQVHYWQELQEIMRWAQSHVFSTLFICWAAQAALYFHYGIEKHPLQAKMFGVFPHHILNRTSRLMRGLDDVLHIPISRHTAVARADIEGEQRLELLADAPESGVGIAASRGGEHVFFFGHSEYDSDTLAQEYWRDREKDLPISVPRHYFPDDDPNGRPIVKWRSHANLLFLNWLNYYVYQETPYDLGQLRRDGK